MFVSNSDNLGATLDLALLTHFAESGSSFMMECAERTEADKKGGHLAVRAADGQLILRESAQCAKEDEAAFQDVSRHQYFNTNNLWVRLDKLKEAIDKCGGLIPLPMIKNGKTVDPKDGSSPAVRGVAARRALVRSSTDGLTSSSAPPICPTNRCGSWRRPWAPPSSASPAPPPWWCPARASCPSRSATTSSSCAPTPTS